MLARNPCVRKKQIQNSVGFTQHQNNIKMKNKIIFPLYDEVFEVLMKEALPLFRLL